MGARADQKAPGWGPFIAEVEQLVAEHRDEVGTVSAVAERLRALMNGGAPDVPVAFRQPQEDRYAMYPLHVAADRSFSIAVAVWGVGQSTPIHDHGAWGVVGVVSGVEHERRYRVGAGGPPAMVEERDLRPGDVVVCCTSDADVHAVSCAGDVDVVAIHVYGTDIGTAVRHSYDPATGERRDFVSPWCAPS